MVAEEEAEALSEALAVALSEALAAALAAAAVSRPQCLAMLFRSPGRTTWQQEPGHPSTRDCSTD